MAEDSLLIAEQCIDQETRPYLFHGREIESVTGRVLLHAIDGAGRPLCGRDHADLTLTEQPWQAGYLPHLPRCRACADAAAAAADDGQPVQGSELPGPASGVDIRLAHGTETEKDARAALLDVLAEHDLRCWMFTDLVTIDENLRFGGVSHPLTLSAALLLRRPAMALTVFLHEQLHWMEGPGTEALAVEFSQRWPDPPPRPAGGTDARSTWTHLSVCALEYQSLAQILGVAAAEAELRQHHGYSWIYEQILTEPEWFSGLLRSHGLEVPTQPPIPRRYFGDPGWATS
jgi:hypothetical protein